MKHVSILIPRGHASVVNIGATHQLLTQANTLLAQSERPPVFDVHMVGLEPVTRQPAGHFMLCPDALIHDVEHTDLIIIPAIHDDPDESYQRNQVFVPWILRHYHAGAEVVSFCIGAFFLAETGLLNGKQCATHTWHAKEFRHRFPNVNLVDETILTDEDGIYTSGGAFAFLNLLVYLIEKYAGREVAVHAARTFSIQIDRHSPTPFIAFEGQKDHEDTTIIQAQHYIEHHYHQPIRVDDLAARLALSRRTLERRFKKATCNTVTEYIQRVKVEAAKKRLETTYLHVNEVMDAVGYSDEKYFRTLFRRLTGLTPIEYRAKYNRARLAI